MLEILIEFIDKDGVVIFENPLWDESVFIGNNVQQDRLNEFDVGIHAGVVNESSVEIKTENISGTFPDGENLWVSEYIR